jgi:hypothetical protein
VGGGVEMPLKLVGELGWRGIFEEAARLAYFVACWHVSDPHA